jgi:hypothetical protein
MMSGFGAAGDNRGGTCFGDSGEPVLVERERSMEHRRCATG